MISYALLRFILILHRNLSSYERSHPSEINLYDQIYVRLFYFLLRKALTKKGKVLDKIRSINGGYSRLNNQSLNHILFEKSNKFEKSEKS